MSVFKQIIAEAITEAEAKKKKIEAENAAINSKLLDFALILGDVKQELVEAFSLRGHNGYMYLAPTFSGKVGYKLSNDCSFQQIEVEPKFGKRDISKYAPNNFDVSLNFGSFSIPLFRIEKLARIIELDHDSIISYLTTLLKNNKSYATQILQSKSVLGAPKVEGCVNDDITRAYPNAVELPPLMVKSELADTLRTLKMSIFSPEMTEVINKSYPTLNKDNARLVLSTVYSAGTPNKVFFEDDGELFGAIRMKEDTFDIRVAGWLYNIKDFLGDYTGYFDLCVYVNNIDWEWTQIGNSFYTLKINFNGNTPVCTNMGRDNLSILTFKELQDFLLKEFSNSAFLSRWLNGVNGFTPSLV